MGLYVLYSLLAHALVAGLFWMPWSFFREAHHATVQPVIPLELVTIAAETVAPPPAAQAETVPDQLKPEDIKAPEPDTPPVPDKPEPTPPTSEPPPPPPVQEQPTPAPPAPAVEPAPVLEQKSAEPLPSPQPQKPDVKEIKEEPKKAPPKEKIKEPDKKTPKKEDVLDRIVKDLTPKKNKKKSSPQKKDVLDDIAAHVKAQNRASDTVVPQVQGIPGDKLSLSEIDAIRSQVAACWNVPAGVRDAENLKVQLRVHMNADGTVHKVDILSKARMRDPLFRAATESAMRALLNPQCNPLKLPANKYNEWKTFTIQFDPKEMFE